MHIEKGNIVNYENEPHMIVHVYTSDYVEIRKVGERFISRVILVHKSKVTEPHE
ncbi:hypothetical protein [Fictibacillus phosphorivorans]|uniref:hypothetical protein n=1 Tax=Fictibacillus phosphorivorans TaxID=1221500 RepID=UPI002041905E|nr:hypothetical protein [Fictibacillus phosphorivorans]MCM3717795.1 hypothetical protein [Fictibacillus phosphorivorans]MCM3777023.1 hypothetical protein [Fictibacillus phosphorivorans]